MLTVDLSIVLIFIMCAILCKSEVLIVILIESYSHNRSQAVYRNEEIIPANRLTPSVCTDPLQPATTIRTCTFKQRTFFTPIGTDSRSRKLNLPALHALDTCLKEYVGDKYVMLRIDIRASLWLVDCTCATCCEKCEVPTASSQKMLLKAAKFLPTPTHLPRRVASVVKLVIWCNATK